MKIFELASNLIIPAAMIVAGLLGIFTPQATSMKQVGRWSGYRTKRSMRTVETWNFANYNAGIIYLFTGFYTIFVTGVICVIIRDASHSMIRLATIVMTIVQIMIFIMPFLYVEKKLETYFDEIGRPIFPEKVFKGKRFNKKYQESEQADKEWNDWYKDEWRDSWKDEWDDWELWEKRQKERNKEKEENIVDMRDQNKVEIDGDRK